MNFLFGWLTDWLKQGLIDAIMGSFANIFDAVNNQIGEIAANVDQTPESWNSGVFSMIRALSDSVIIPVAGIILTFVVCYELIHMVIERNNMHDFDTFIFYKWIFSATCSHTNTTLQEKPCRHSPSGAKNGGLPAILEA
ncbi:MAG: CD0415/CD1112 family protein, partial [Oscillospiraceae bacterium]|nr:CD0415/CD1112 family protein [Oscillospiraceae bacterium]